MSRLNAVMEYYHKETQSALLAFLAAPFSFYNAISSFDLYRNINASQNIIPVLY